MDQNSISVGVVVERREIDNPWQDYTFRAIAVIPDAPACDGWRLMREGEGWTHFHAVNLTLELFKGETEGYRFNLSQPQPSIYVVLRPGESDEEQDVEPFHVTVCPYEAMGYAESGDEIVEGVPIPEETLNWIQEFVTAHHVDTPFKKRKNKRFKDSDNQRGRPRVG